MNKNGLLLLLAITLLAGCTNPPVSPSLPVRLTPDLPATIMLTMTPLPTPTLTVTPETRFTRQCLSIDDKEVELSKVSTGTILIGRLNPDTRLSNTELLVLSDIKTGNEYELPPASMNSVLIGSSVAPNRDMYAKLERVYNDQGVGAGIVLKNILWVFDARANLVAKTDFNRTDLDSLSWLDNERLIISTEKYGTLLLVNPFTGEQKLLADELPDLFPYNLDTYSYINPHSRWPISYSPDLKWVVYYSLRKEINGYMEGSAVYDIVTKQTIWKADSGLGQAWSPDGQGLAIASELGDRQLYLFSRSGQVKAVLDESVPHEVDGFSWSPDGNFIAFWNEESLMIYDRQTDMIFDTCIKSQVTYRSPLWSPDSHQIIASYVSENPTTMVLVEVLVDLQARRAYKIKELPTGTLGVWMNSIP